ncbi:hypothetical protein WN48_09750 [Eufriesea mexicana]|uniref:Uncharacterized protein n=1 Tax=Eufriesea mexicana TaxID=516756 RepID=A0A310SIU2_9HYME|nr:hypothetical protein WN48_09750 [Eufriesea mexicana]
MESDTATDWSSSARKDSLETSMPRKFRKDSFRTKGATLNWAMCALCITSLAVSGLLMYRELGLESRIANLEARCQIQETPDILIQRLKREVQQELKMHRSASESNVFRIKRDVSECACPQEFIPLAKYFHDSEILPSSHHPFGISATPSPETFERPQEVPFGNLVATTHRRRKGNRSLHGNGDNGSSPANESETRNAYEGKIYPELRPQEPVVPLETIELGSLPPINVTLTQSPRNHGIQVEIMESRRVITGIPNSISPHGAFRPL